MGREPQWDDPTYGDNCALCFEAGKTPDSVQVDFSGVVRCPGYLDGIPEGSYTLAQTGFNPCTFQKEEWFIPGDPWGPGLIRLRMEAGHTQLSAFLAIGINLFEHDKAEECAKTFTNQTTCPGGAASGGTAALNWENIAKKIVTEQNFGSSGKMLYEKWELDDHNEVYRICSKFDKTSCYIKHLLGS